MNEKKEISQAFAVGVFLIAFILIFAWLLLFLRPSVGDEKRRVKVRFSNIEKVSLDTPVSYAGKVVGQVRAIDLIENARELTSGVIYPYELTLAIDSHIKVYTCDEICLGSLGLFGERVIAILPKTDGTEVTDQILYGCEDPLRVLLAQAETTLTTLNDFLVKNEKSFSKASEQAEKLFLRANELDVMGQLAHATQEFSNLTGDFSSILYQVAHGQGMFGQLVSNPELYCKFSMMLDRLDILLYDLNHYGILFQFNNNWQRKRAWQNRQQRLLQ